MSRLEPGDTLDSERVSGRLSRGRAGRQQRGRAETAANLWRGPGRARCRGGLVQCCAVRSRTRQQLSHGRMPQQLSHVHRGSSAPIGRTSRQSAAAIGRAAAHVIPAAAVLLAGSQAQPGKSCRQPPAEKFRTPRKRFPAAIETHTRPQKCPNPALKSPPVPSPAKTASPAP